MKNDIYQHKQLQERQCIECGQYKLMPEFPKSGKYKDNSTKYHSCCKSCFNQRSKTIIDRRRSTNKCLSCGRVPESGKKQCRKCKKRDVARVVRNRIKLKQKCIKYLGNKCADCGLEISHYSIYDFHHTNPKNKEMTVNKMLTKTSKWDIIKKELDKCILLCSNCHRIRHEKSQVC